MQPLRMRLHVRQRLVRQRIVTRPKVHPRILNKLALYYRLALLILYTWFMSSLEYQASIKENVRNPAPGLLSLIVLLAGLFACILCFIVGAANQQGVLIG